MTSITDVLEELQLIYPKIDIFDLDTYKDKPALSILKPNSSLFLYSHNSVIRIGFENEITGETLNENLTDEDNIADLYQDLSNLLLWIAKQNENKAVQKELYQILTELEESGIEPDGTYDPNY